MPTTHRPPTTSRRSFLETAALTGAALAAAPSSILNAADSRIALALVGCAHIHTPGFVDLLKARPDVVVKYVWDPLAPRAEVRAKQLGAKAIVDLNEIWGDREVLGVVICSETNRHLELVTAAAKAKKHLFVEKPLGVNAEDSFTMAKAIETAALFFTTGYFMRADPKHLFLKDQIGKGAFGKITRVAAWNCHSGSLGGWFDDKPDDPANSWRWMADPKIAGVGAFGDLGTHSLDILMWIFGNVSAVAADIRVVTSRYGAECDENGQSMIKFASGVMGTLAAGWVDVANPVTLMINGTEGQATVFQDRLYFKSTKVQGADGKQPWTELPQGPPPPLQQFVDTLAGKGLQPLVMPREAAARVAVMEAMYKASRVGGWIQPG